MARTAPHKSTQDLPKIAINIDGEKISYTKFLSIQSDFFEILKEVGHEFFDAQKTFSWTVLGASMNSPYKCEIVANPLRKAATAEDAHGLIETFNYGLKSIDEKAEWPPFFTEKSVKKLKKIGDAIDGKNLMDVFFAGTIFGRPWEKKFSGSNIAANASKLLEAKYEGYDSVEGKLLAIDLHNKTAFRLYTDEDESSLLCTFSPELKQDAIDAIEKRVYVYGLVRERENGKKVSMKVREIEQMPSVFDMPMLHEILGMGAS